MKKRSVGRPRDGDPAETRREILKAAEESFAASGFVGATTRQVAARAGVNVATLHYHFGNKERLYRAVLEAAVSGGVAPTSNGSTPADRLSSLVEALWNSGWERPSLSRLSLLHRLAGPAPSAGGAPDPHEDPRAALLAKTIADITGKPAPSAGETARLVLVLLD
ncbi:MAG: TetR/AcrR family transcriptional regulator, partial [Thermoanaerobaculia bacterium]